jgi:pimeloyl-ACP methyl ester carboxylesterase
MKTAVVLVHGLFLNGAEFGLLRRRLAAAHGFQSHRFSYPTVRGSMEATLERLERFVERIDAERVHFVGHSLGGIVLHRYFQDFPDSQASRARAGRVLLLGAPLAGSASARAVAKHALLRRVIGPLVGAELVQECSPRQWSCGCELGLIAGSRPLGLGRFFARFQEDCDGTVAVSETKLPGHTAHLTLPVSHMGMLVDAKVARQAGTFLSEGRFEPV